MKVRVERDVFAEAVAWTARSLPARPTMPVLAGLLLEVEDHTLTLSGFDYEVSAQVGLDVTAMEGGRVLVSGRLLAEIARSLPAQPVEIVTDGSRAVLTCGAARFTLPTMAAEDYPTLPQMPAATGSLDGAVFAHAVAQVAVAAGRDDTLPVLTGVRLEIDGDSVTLAATDRYRLAVRTLTWAPREPDQSATALIPARTLADTAKTLSAGSEVTLALSTGGAGEGMMGFTGAGRHTTTRLLDGEFPKYRSLIPAEAAATAGVATAPLVEAVKRVSLVAARSTPIRLRFTGGEVVLEAGGGDEPEASETLDAGLEGEEMSIAFNPSFLLDGLSALDSDTAAFAFTSPSKPAVLTGQGAGSDYRYLLMPVRLSG